MSTKYNKKQVMQPPSNQYFLGGMEGSDWGNLGAEVAAGAGTGALSGSVVPGLGNAAGAIIGGGIGLVKGLIGASKSVKDRELQDEADVLKAKQQTGAVRNNINTLTGSGAINLVAMGGNINGGDNTFREFNNGSSHEQNPLGGVPISFDNQGVPNTVEEGETMKDTFVFSDRLTLENPEQFDLSGSYKNKTFADISKSLNNSYEERPNDSIAKGTFDAMTDRLKVANDFVKQNRALEQLQESIQLKCGGNLFAEGGALTEGEYDLGDMDLDMEEIEYLKSQGYDVEVLPNETQQYAEGGEIGSTMTPAEEEAAARADLANFQAISQARGSYGPQGNEPLSGEPVGITNDLLLKQAYKESTFNPKAKSPKGYKGLTQIGDDTIKDYMKATGDKEVDPYNPEHAIKVQKFVMNDLYNADFIDKQNQSDEVRLAKTLAAYNWGRGNLLKHLNAQKKSGKDIYNDLGWMDTLPNETRDYIGKILLNKDKSFNDEFNQAVEKDTKYKELYK